MKIALANNSNSIFQTFHKKVMLTINMHYCCYKDFILKINFFNYNNES